LRSFPTANKRKVPPLRSLRFASVGLTGSRSGAKAKARHDAGLFSF
jgi:hypothetical protein